MSYREDMLFEENKRLKEKIKRMLQEQYSKSSWDYGVQGQTSRLEELEDLGRRSRW